MKKLVTERALIERIRRKLRKEGLSFFKNTRGPNMENLGKFYTVDMNRNCIKFTVHDLEKFARENGFLKPFEAIAPEED
jgi:hypothetical protein